METTNKLVCDMRRDVRHLTEKLGKKKIGVFNTGGNGATVAEIENKTLEAPTAAPVVQL